MNQSETSVVIAAKTRLTESIWRFELIPEGLQALPPFTAGAHITVRTPNGSVRSYSLTDPPGCHNRYAITVYRDTTGREDQSILSIRPNAVTGWSFRRLETHSNWRPHAPISSSPEA